MLPSSSSSRSTNEAVAARGNKAARALSTPTKAGETVAVSTTEEGPSLRELIGQHSAAVQEGRRATARRQAIINYKPKGDGEAKLKLTYLAAYLIATKGTLSAKEMSSLIADRPI
jgi:hypothetical protein